MDREARKTDFKTSAEISWKPADESGEYLGEEILSRGERNCQNSQAVACLASCSSGGKEAGVAGAGGGGGRGGGVGEGQVAAKCLRSGRSMQWLCLDGRHGNSKKYQANIKQ